MSKSLTAIYRSKHGGTWFLTCVLSQFDMPCIFHDDLSKSNENLIANICSGLEKDGLEFQIKYFDSILEIPEYFGFD